MSLWEIGIQKGQKLHQLAGEILGADLSAPQGGGGRHVGARPPPDAEVDPARRHRGEKAELFRNHKRRKVRKHHPARAKADALRFAHQPGQQHGRRGCVDARHRIMLGHPVAAEAVSVGETGKIDAGGNRLARGRSLTCHDKVQNGEGNGRIAPPCSDDSRIGHDHFKTSGALRRAGAFASI